MAPSACQYGRTSTASSNEASIVKANGVTPACDRCRGQKLKCVWDNGSQQCRRCARAKADCTIPRPRPMGRPPRQFRGSGGYLGWEDSSVPSLEDGTSMAVQLAEDAMPIDGGNASRSVSGVPTSEALWSLSSAPSMVGRNGLSSPRSGIVQPDIFDFLNCFLEPTRSGIFALSNETSSSAMPPIRTDLPTSSSILASEGIAENHHRMEDLKDPASDNRKDNYIQCLTQLCELNVALYQHPLYANPVLGNPAQSQPL